LNSLASSAEEAAASLSQRAIWFCISYRITGDFWTTRTVLKQTDFGIEPISIGGGMIKVKNEVEIDFQIFARQ
jgi:hypothetical protein